MSLRIAFPVLAITCVLAFAGCEKPAPAPKPVPAVPENKPAVTEETPPKETGTEEMPTEENPAEANPSDDKPGEETPSEDKPDDTSSAQAAPEYEPTDFDRAAAEQLAAGGDMVQWGDTPQRNNVPHGTNMPVEWNVGKFDANGEWNRQSVKNILWMGRLGSQSYGNPVIANGRVYVGTNNALGWVKRYPAKVDLGCLLCFRESDGKFLWQHSSEKLTTGRVHDWPFMGICCSPYAEGDRIWFVTSRGEVLCLDAEGFYDDENDGPYKDEPNENKDEADVIWSFDMMKELLTSQHNMCSCSVTVIGDLLFVCTSNGVDETHVNIPAPEAPSFICMDKNTGKVLWTDNTPGINVLHGQWSSPAYSILGGVPQIIFGGGDGWLYSFQADEGKDGKPTLLWKFDCNPKKSKYVVSGASTRNHLIATPVIYEGLVYIGVGEDPEHGEGEGHLWCINPTRRGDVSPTLVVKRDDPKKTPIEHKRLQACVEEEGDIEIPNPNSAMVWHYDKYDLDGDGDAAFEETIHRTMGTVAIKNNLLIVADFSGLVHCLDAKTGVPHWTYDMLAASWSSPLIVDDKIYIGDEDGDVSIFNLSGDKEKALKEINGEWHPINAFAGAKGGIEMTSMGTSVYSTPVVANNVMYILNKNYLFAIKQGASVVADPDRPAHEVASATGEKPTGAAD